MEARRAGRSSGAGRKCDYWVFLSWKNSPSVTEIADYLCLAYGLILAHVGRAMIRGKMLDRFPGNQLLLEERDLVSQANQLNRGSH